MDNSKDRYSPRLSGAGKQALQQMSDKNILRAILSPALRALIMREFGCIDSDIDKAVQEGVYEFGEDFKEYLAKQRGSRVLPGGELTLPEGENLSECPKCLENSIQIYDGTGVSEAITGIPRGTYYCMECGWTSLDAPEEDNDE